MCGRRLADARKGTPENTAKAGATLVLNHVTYPASLRWLPRIAGARSDANVEAIHTEWRNFGGTG